MNPKPNHSLTLSLNLTNPNPFCHERRRSLISVTNSFLRTLITPSGKSFLRTIITLSRTPLLLTLTPSQNRSSPATSNGRLMFSSGVVSFSISIEYGKV
ncbi:hypothetical protein QL285_054703 [Trifolium repens]|nr:hypothetical protein QL285_054703 [Trifolium repens]